jgi:microcystin degradation protein MlrC
MVCEHLEDGEGEFLARLRHLIGSDIPMAVSLDLHANVTEAMVEHASVIDIYRTYPHVDMAETGARTAGHLHALLGGGQSWAKALRRNDFLIPMNWGCTLLEPARTLYAGLSDLVGGQVTAVSLACGFSLADIAEVGPAVLAHGLEQAAVDDAADHLLEELNARESDFAGKLWEPAEAVAEAKGLAARSTRPVILADTQDNPGGGGPGDTTGLLAALVEGGARGAVLAMICDPQSAAEAHAAGEGATVVLALGGKSGVVGVSPYEARFRVLRLTDGNFTATGPMWRGSRMRLGPMALLEVDGVRVLVASKAVQTADRAILRHVGIEPAEEAILALKSSVHFRNDFQDIAEQILVVRAPGPVHADPGDLSFDNIRPGVQLRPRP